MTGEEPILPVAPSRPPTDRTPPPYQGEAGWGLRAVPQGRPLLWSDLGEEAGKGWSPTHKRPHTAMSSRRRPDAHPHYPPPVTLGPDPRALHFAQAIAANEPTHQRPHRDVIPAQAGIHIRIPPRPSRPRPPHRLDSGLRRNDPVVAARVCLLHLVDPGKSALRLDPGLGARPRVRGPAPSTGNRLPGLIAGRWKTARRASTTALTPTTRSRVLRATAGNAPRSNSTSAPITERAKGEVLRLEGRDTVPFELGLEQTSLAEISVMVRR
jgi:hypothetical protein